MKTLKYIVIDAVAGSAIMLLLYFLAIGTWSLGKDVYAWFAANGASPTSGAALSMIIAGTVIGGLIGFIASRGPQSMMFDPKKVTPDQLDQMEKILTGVNTMTFNADTSEVDIESIKEALNGLGANPSGVDVRNRSR